MGAENGNGGDHGLKRRIPPDTTGKRSRPAVTCRSVGFSGRLAISMLLFFCVAQVGAVSAEGNAQVVHDARGGFNMLWDKDKRRRMACQFEGDDAMPMDVDSEPSDDGDDGILRIISANVHALGPRVEEVAMWGADLIAVQETKLASHAIKDAYAVAKDKRWTLVHGKPCPPTAGGGRRQRKRTNAAKEANSGGVAWMIKNPRKPISHSFDASADELHGSGRLQRIKFPLAGDARCLTAACLYGISGANSDAAKRKQNEVLVAGAVLDLLRAGGDPYLIVGGH